MSMTEKTFRSVSRKAKQFEYERARNTVIELIRRENLKPGDRLPSERELSKRMGLNHQTIRRGLAALVEERVIDRQVGSGTFLRFVPEDSVATQTDHTMYSTAAHAPTHLVNGSLVGAIILAKAGHFFSEVIEHLHAEAQKRQLQLAIRMTDSFGPEAIDLSRQLVEQGCCSVVVPLLPDLLNLGDLSRLVQKSTVPVVIGASYPGLEANCYERPEAFGKADIRAIEMVCRYFYALKYRRIAFFGPEGPSVEASGRRVLSYLQFVNRCGLNSYVGLVNNEPDDVDRVVKGWMELKGDLAVICYDDDAAIRLMTSLHKHDLRIPEDVAVVGFNNIQLGQMADPPLSTVQFDYGYVAGALLDHALAMSHGKSAQKGEEAKEYLVIRESCGGRQRAGAQLSELVERAHSTWISRESAAV